VTDEAEASEARRERPTTGADRRSRRAQPAPSGGKGRATPVRDLEPVKLSPPARLRRFLREVVAELRKVIWPTRKQLVTYTFVVLVFVSIMVAFVAGLDLMARQGVLFLFGN